MAWFSAVPALAVAAALLLVPGWVTARALRFTGFEALGLAPVFSSAICGTFGVLYGSAGIRWSPLTFLVAVAISVAIAFGLSKVPALRGEAQARLPVTLTSRVSITLTLLSLAVACGLGALRLVHLFGAPDNIAQVFDNVFHLNAIRYIIESGNASSLTLASLQGQAGLEAVYPASWHTFAATIVEITGVDPQVAENSLNLVIGALVWPLSCVFFVRTVISTHPVAVFTAAILSVGQVTFPFLMTVWGPLFPYALAVSLLPLGLGIVAVLVRVSLDKREHLGKWGIALVLAVVGMGTAHMSSFNALIALAAPLLFLAWFRLRSHVNSWSFRSKNAWIFIVGSFIFSLFILLSWTKIRPALYENWGPTSRSGPAIGEVLTNSTMHEAPAWIVSVLVLAGVIAAFNNKKHRWLTISYTIAAALYVVDAAWSKGFWRDFITGTWYQDTYRLAALLPVLVTPLAALGALSLWKQGVTATESRLKKQSHPGSTISVVFGAVAAGIALFAATQGPVVEYVERSKPVYGLDQNSAILSKDELALVKRLPTLVPEGAKIADNPWNGSSWAYAFGSRDVLTPHLFAAPDPERNLISQRLKFTPADPAVCAALRHENVSYVLDFGNRYLLNLPASNDYPGVTDIGDRPGFQEIDSEGNTAKLYKITSCG